MHDFLMTLPWQLYCALLSFGAAIYGIAMRFVGGETHPSFFGMVFNGISSIILSVLFVLYALSGNPIELTWAAFLIAACGGIGLIGVDLSIIAMYKAGAPVSLGMPIIRVSVSLATAAIGILFFYEDLTTLKIIGIFLSSIGIFLAVPARKKKGEAA